jgi:hypothetical protein
MGNREFFMHLEPSKVAQKFGTFHLTWGNKPVPSNLTVYIIMLRTRDRLSGVVSCRAKDAGWRTPTWLLMAMVKIRPGKI